MATLTGDISAIEKTVFGETVFLNFQEWLNADTLELSFNLKDSDNVQIDLSGCSAVFLLLKDKRTNNNLALISTAVDLSDMDYNVKVTVQNSDIADAGIKRGRYYYKIIMTYTSGSVNTEFAGCIEFI